MLQVLPVLCCQMLTGIHTSDGTPILQWNNALSYVCYFVFVWWIWIAQVAYNMRFRQADWLHRIWVFIQLIVFSGLAAFTKDFNITHGLWVNPGETLTDQLLSQSGDASQLAELDLRIERLPRLNDKGLSTVVAASRLVLLLQYAIGVYLLPIMSHSPTLTTYLPYSLLSRKKSETQTDIANGTHGVSRVFRSLFLRRL